MQINLAEKIPRLPVSVAARLAACVLALGCTIPGGLAYAEGEHKISVLVNDDPITDNDIRQRVHLLIISDSSRAKLLKEKLSSSRTSERFRNIVSGKARPTSREEYEAVKAHIEKLKQEVEREVGSKLRKRAIEELIDEKLMLQDAKKLNIEVSDAQIDERIALMAKRSKDTKTGKPLTPDQFLKQLADLKVNTRRFKEKIRANIAFELVLRRKYGQDIQTAAQQQAVKALDRAAGAGGSANQSSEFQLQKVKLALPAAADQKTIAARLVEANRLRGRFSTCQSTRDLVKPLKGGSVTTIGTRAASAVAPPIRAMLLNAKAGEMTPPSITGTSIELYAVCSRRQTAGDSDQKRLLQAKFQRQEISVLSRRHLRNIRQDAHIDYR